MQAIPPLLQAQGENVVEEEKKVLALPCCCCSSHGHILLAKGWLLLAG